MPTDRCLSGSSSSSSAKLLVVSFRPRVCHRLQPPATLRRSALRPSCGCVTASRLVSAVRRPSLRARPTSLPRPASLRRFVFESPTHTDSAGDQGRARAEEEGSRGSQATEGGVQAKDVWLHVACVSFAGGWRPTWRPW
jgi:hypothetical protein